MISLFFSPFFSLSLYFFIHLYIFRCSADLKRVTRRQILSLGYWYERRTRSLFSTKKKGTCRYGIISSGKYCVIHDYNTVTGRGWVVMEEDVDEEMWPNFASILQVTWCSAEPTRRTHSSTMDGYRPRTVLRYERGGGTKRWNSVSQLSLPCVVWWESTTWCSQNRQ